RDDRGRERPARRRRGAGAACAPARESPERKLYRGARYAAGRGARDARFAQPARRRHAREGAHRVRTAGRELRQRTLTGAEGATTVIEWGPATSRGDQRSGGS